MNKLVFLAVVPILLAAVPNAYVVPILLAAVPNAYAGDADCDTDPNDSRCNGETGASGMTFCDLAWSNPEDVDRFGDCYDRDFSTIDCDEYPDSSRCSGYRGEGGKIYCDLQKEEVGYEENCYEQ
jgi:hypothetical protein